MGVCILSSSEGSYGHTEQLAISICHGGRAASGSCRYALRWPIYPNMANDLGELMNTNPVFEVLVGVLIIVFLSWFARVSEQTGYIAVGLVLLFWLLWSMKNYGKISSFAAKATGGTQ